MPRDSRKLTASEFLQCADGDARLDLEAGFIVREPPSGGTHGSIAARLVLELGGFVRQRKLGHVTTADAGYVLARNPDTVRCPDVAFVSHERLGSAGLTERFVQIAPDLAVELRSPSDTTPALERKVRDYLSAGCRLVWIVDPRSRTVTVRRPGSEASLLKPGDTLEGEDVLPGFSLPVHSLFDE